MISLLKKQSSFQKQEESVTSSGHKKHTDLVRPDFGNFNRNEWSFVGAPCDTIKALSGEIIESLSGIYKCAYADASHDVEPGNFSDGTFLEYTLYTDHSLINYNRNLNSFELRNEFSAVDIVLVNGNHHRAKSQVIIINSSKKASLQKRVDQLTNVQLILLDEGEPIIFDFIKEAIPNWQSIPLYRLHDTEPITTFFKNKMQQAKPVLNGLVLAGGKSQRMGFDKGAIKWYNTEQRYYMADLLKNICEEVFISCNSDQVPLVDSYYKTLPDTFTGLGPYGAILSAFREKPDNAWLVVACDLPLLDEQTLSNLVDNRKVSAIATAYKNPVNDFPEPLITIWEPKSYPVLLSFLAQGYSCPRKVLINSDAAIINAINPEALTNVNTPEDMAKVQQLFKSTVSLR